MNAPTSPAEVTRAERAARQAEVVRALQAVLPAHALLWHADDTVPYECDGLTAYRQRPLVVALPETEAQVAAVLQACHALNAPVVARGALVYQDDTNKRCTTVATANLLIGVAAVAVAGGAGNTAGRVRLNASFRANDP